MSTFFFSDVLCQIHMRPDHKIQWCCFLSLDFYTPENIQKLTWNPNNRGLKFGGWCSFSNGWFLASQGINVSIYTTPFSQRSSQWALLGSHWCKWYFRSQSEPCFHACFEPFFFPSSPPKKKFVVLNFPHKLQLLEPRILYLFFLRHVFFFVFFFGNPKNYKESKVGICRFWVVPPSQDAGSWWQMSRFRLGVFRNPRKKHIIMSSWWWLWLMTEKGATTSQCRLPAKKWHLGKKKQPNVDHHQKNT